MHFFEVFTLAISTSPLFKLDLFSNVRSETRPIVLWHGMGDFYNSSSMLEVVQLVSNIHPDAPVYSISLDLDYDKDQQLGLFGNLTQQIADVCLQLHNHSLYEFDAIGFSQGGLFLRSVLQTCDGIKVNNLVTFGSPHQGVFDLPLCKNGDWLCKRRNEVLKKQVYKPQVQRSLVQAQYFRDVYRYDEYLEKSLFIADINNDRLIREDFADRMVNNLLGKFVMIMFNEDTTLVPKESAWFNDYDPVLDRTLNFTETQNYQRNQLGLQDLYQNGKIVFKSIDDQHMSIDDQFLTQIIEEYTGGELTKFYI